MPRFTVELKGFDDFGVKISKFNRKASDGAKRAIARVASSTSKDAKKEAPVDTGNLRNMIGWALVEGGFAALVFSRAAYSVWVEFGTTRAPQQPFMRPAFEDGKDQFDEELRQLAREFKL